MNFVPNKKLNVDDIKSIISTLSLQEHFHSFVSIVDIILNTDNYDNYWDLISKNLYKDDYEKILEFLSPGGQFINFLLKEMLIDKSMNSFEFPIQRLSLCTQKLITSSNLPIFISSKLHSKVQGTYNTVLLLNAFEYYMFSFFSYIYHPSVTSRIDWNGATDSIYCQLVFRYLDMFLFNSVQSGLLMQLALQSRNRSSYNPAFNRSINGSFSSFSVPSPFHDSILGRSRFSSKENKNLDMTELYFTETIVQIINEFWLNFTSESPVPNSTPAKVGLSAVPSLRALPTVDQVCLVRVFLKHAYHFCYAARVSHLTPGSQIECDFLAKLHIYRQKVLPKFLIGKIYCYLHYCFCVWPADLSFKIVMETWLSAIQPWRYTDQAHHGPEQHDNSLLTVAPVIVAEQWQPFMVDNIDLYLQLLLSFTRRISRMDLTVLRNGQMLFRVAKVLSQSGLGSLMDRQTTTATKQQSLSRSMTRHSGVVDDGAWQEIQSHMSVLFREMARALDELQTDRESRASGGGMTTTTTTTTTRPGWIQWLWDTVTAEVLHSNDHNPRRLVTYLQQSRTMLASVLGIDDVALAQSRGGGRNDYLEYKDSQPDHVVTYNGSRLTDFGRFQVSRGMCRLETESPRDYYERPVCSYEVGVLVSLCRRLSTVVTGQWEEPLQRLCLREDLRGRMARYWLIGRSRPLSPVDGGTNDASCDLGQWLACHPPRLRIRFLASKTVLFWLAVLYLAAWVALDLGPGPVSLVLVLSYLATTLATVLLTSFH